MKVFFVRHGQTTANLTRVYSGQHDFLLTDLGKEQAMAIRPYMEKIAFDKVFTSDLTRVVQTQKLALPDAEVALRSPLIREINAGSITGTPIGSSVTVNEEGEKDYSPYGGEKASQVCARLKKFLEENVEPYDYKNVAVFAHHGILIAMLSLAVGKVINSADVLVKNCGVAIFEYKDGNWVLLSWNNGSDFTE
ncbi:MAG: histidine phosphatase family protein [Ruminococcaceae bacterium]|nr:histidine phosphatase family protein [Oscillospiraceae bacterium]